MEGLHSHTHMHADTRPQWIYSATVAGVSLVTAFSFTLMDSKMQTFMNIHAHSIWTMYTYNPTLTALVVRSHTLTHSHT